MRSVPIKHWRDDDKPGHISALDVHRACAPDIDKGHAYCGRKNTRTDVWDRVTCADCQAARRADEEAR
jgi:hypothetical protein